MVWDGKQVSCSQIVRYSGLPRKLIPIVRSQWQVLGFE